MPDPSADLREATPSGDIEALAARFIAAIEAGDIDTLIDCFCPEAVIWHNNDEVEVDRIRVGKVLRWVQRNVTGLRYADLRRTSTPTGYVQQHVVVGTASSGASVRIPACLVVTVSNGRILRLEEYLDSRQSAVLVG